jgi:ribonuclease T1
MLRMLRLGGIALALLLPVQAQAAPATFSGQNGLPVVTLAELPTEARDTLRAIKQGGPFAYERDGVVFKNYERILPKRPRGYYHEYTVKTPGTRHRGARRIISGGADEYYYTADHYKTFKQIRE